MENTQLSTNANKMVKGRRKAESKNQVVYYPSSNHHYQYAYYPALLPLPHQPSPLLFQLPPNPPHFHQNRTFLPKPTYFPQPFAASSHVQLTDVPFLPANGLQQSRKQLLKEIDEKPITCIKAEALTVARRPDTGGVEGVRIPLIANHFRIQFDSSKRIFHYNVEISPTPSKEIARLIKRKMVQDNTVMLSGSLPAYDGRKNLYSSIEFQNDRLEFLISLPITTPKTLIDTGGSNIKLFRVNVKLVSKLDGKELMRYLNNEKEDSIPIPQDYLHALDVILRENATEDCISVGRSLYSSSMGGAKEIGGGAVGLRGFFQSLRPTQQGLALNMDFSVNAFHESIGVIPYLQKRVEFLHDLSARKTRGLIVEERKEVERALKNVRVFVCHRETVQRYRIYGLTEESTENLWFTTRDGKNLRLVTYFRDHYNYDIQFRNLPCLQISRNRPCYLPMELCMICEGQKFMGKLSDDQTARIIKMGCQKPKERRAIIDEIMRGPVGPRSGYQENEFKLNISSEMTKLSGRLLQPPKLRLGDGGQVRVLNPSRHDRQWNLLDSHVFEGARIARWALISFGGTSDQKSYIPRFIKQLSKKCEQLGIILNKDTIVSPIFESSQVLQNVSVLESKLNKIYTAAGSNLTLLICVMEKKHKGYADLKRIAETNVGVLTQCCLYPNVTRSSSQFLVNLALKINAKVGGCTVALYNSLPSHIPRILNPHEPVMFMGADVTHPHPLDDTSPSVAAVVGSMNWPAANKYVSKIRSQAHRQEIIHNLVSMVVELLDDFRQQVQQLPRRIIFFRDGVSETQFCKVLEVELKAIREACSMYTNYKPPITFAVVQKRHHTRLFPAESDSDENIPPGTVVDTVVTHPKEFDFYLCSHFGLRGTSRPTHYHILWDENDFTSDELQKLIYDLCFTYMKCTKPVSLVPPVYYAHLAAYRGRLYVERPESATSGRNSPTMCRSSLPPANPLPNISENVKKLMFYC